MIEYRLKKDSRIIHHMTLEQFASSVNLTRHKDIRKNITLADDKIATMEGKCNSGTIPEAITQSSEEK